MKIQTVAALILMTSFAAHGASVCGHVKEMSSKGAVINARIETSTGLQGLQLQNSSERAISTTSPDQLLLVTAFSTNSKICVSVPGNAIPNPIKIYNSGTNPDGVYNGELYITHD